MYRLPIIFAVVMITLIGGILLLFGGHKSPKTHTTASTTTVTHVKTLPEYASTDAMTTMTIDGHINGDELHRAIRIKISRDHRELDVIQGYSGTVISSQTIYNTQDAYDVFLRSINNSGFLLKYALPKNSKAALAPADEKGQCPQGNRYIFELNQEGYVISHLWSSDCGAGAGTLGGDSNSLQQLFEAQIPQYQNTVQNINLNAN